MPKKMILVVALVAFTIMLVSCSVQSPDPGTSPASTGEPGNSPEPGNTPGPSEPTPAAGGEGALGLSTLYGDWVISSHLAGHKVSTYSQEAIEAMIGKELTCSETRVAFDDDVLENPYFTLTIEAKSDHDQMNDVTFEDLGIAADSLILVDIFTDEALQKYWISPIMGIYLKDADTLILIGEGEYFEAARQS